MSTTESRSRHDHLEKMSVAELLSRINDEDASVPAAVARALPQIEALVEHLVERMQRGGRLFYLGAGTSGRLGILDASECPPTYGVDPGLVVALMAGGDEAIRRAVEGAEDDPERGWRDLAKHDIEARDFVVGIAASGRTPYVLGAVREAKRHGVGTGCITCNEHTDLAAAVDHPIEVIVGPEFVTGSTRMKAGTAQKLVLNMISTTAMIRLGRVVGNAMVDMHLSNEKLRERGIRMVRESVDVDDRRARELLAEHGSVRAAIEAARRGGASKR